MGEPVVVGIVMTYCSNEVNGCRSSIMVSCVMGDLLQTVCKCAQLMLTRWVQLQGYVCAHYYKAGCACAINAAALAGADGS